jgi:hypothetical protein
MIEIREDDFSRYQVLAGLFFGFRISDFGFSHHAMDVQKIAIKLFAADPVPPLHDFIPVFHRWIQTHAVADHLLIDVADYAHVIAGPGVVLVSSEANFYIDYAGNRPGLLYVRKTPLPGNFGERLETVTVACLRAAKLLEEDAALVGKLRFKTDELLVRLNDRLLAPNTDDTFARSKDALASLATTFFGAGATLQRGAAAAKPFEVQIKSNSTASVSQILDRLAVPA